MQQTPGSHAALAQDWAVIVIKIQHSHGSQTFKHQDPLFENYTLFRPTAQAFIVKLWWGPLSEAFVELPIH